MPRKQKSKSTTSEAPSKPQDPVFKPALEVSQGLKWKDGEEQRMVAVMPGIAGDYIIMWQRGDAQTRIRLSRKALRMTLLVLSQVMEESA